MILGRGRVYHGISSICTPLTIYRFVHSGTSPECTNIALKNSLSSLPHWIIQRQRFRTSIDVPTEYTASMSWRRLYAKPRDDETASFSNNVLAPGMLYLRARVLIIVRERWLFYKTIVFYNSTAITHCFYDSLRHVAQRILIGTRRHRRRHGFVRRDHDDEDGRTPTRIFSLGSECIKSRKGLERVALRIRQVHYGNWFERNVFVHSESSAPKFLWNFFYLFIRLLFFPPIAIRNG